MNYGTLVKGALALSLSLIVASASAATTTYNDDQKYGVTFEPLVGAATVENDHNYTNNMPIVDATLRDEVNGVGWFSGDAESDESKIIERTDAVGGQALQLNTDASTLTNKFGSTLAGELNTGIAANGAYFETEVKFVPSDTPDAGITGGQDATKFAIYAYANEEADPPVTNLVVYHAYVDYNDNSLADNNYIGYTNEIFDVDIDATQYVNLRVEMKKGELAGAPVNLFSVKVGTADALESDLAFEGDIWFLTVEDTNDNEALQVSSLNFKGTGEIDNIKAGTIAGTTEYAINWTGSQNVVVSNATAELTVADTNFTAGAVLTFYPTEGSITNVNGVAQDPALEVYTYTVGTEDAIVTVLAGEEVTPPASDEFKAGDNVDGTITADQAAWLNSYIGTYTYAQLAALTGWQDKYLLNVDPFTGAGTLTVTAITVGTDVQVTIALARTEGETAVTGKAIKGVLKLYGTADLGTAFEVLSTATVSDDDFSEGDTTTATFTGTTEKFFKAVIDAPAAPAGN